jgi:hypothetical protein
VEVRGEARRLPPLSRERAPELLQRAAHQRFVRSRVAGRALGTVLKVRARRLRGVAPGDGGRRARRHRRQAGAGTTRDTTGKTRARRCATASLAVVAFEKAGRKSHDVSSDKKTFLFA